MPFFCPQSLSRYPEIRQMLFLTGGILTPHFSREGGDGFCCYIYQKMRIIVRFLMMCVKSLSVNYLEHDLVFAKTVPLSLV